MLNINRIYQNIPVDKIPWNSETPPGCVMALDTGLATIIYRVMSWRGVELGDGEIMHE